MKKTFHEICHESKQNIEETTVEEVMNMIKNNEDFMLIDIREDNEFHKGCIKGSKHIGRGILERDVHLHVPSHEANIVLYCNGGFRSILAAESLQRMGYRNVKSMFGGWKEWNRKGGQTE